MGRGVFVGVTVAGSTGGLSAFQLIRREGVSARSGTASACFAGHEHWRIREPDSIRSLFRRLPENASRLISAVVMGVVSGLSAVAFMLCVQFVFDNGIVRLSRMPLPVFIPASFAIVVVSCLIVGLLLWKLSPDSSGSGIPQLKTAFWKDLGFTEFRHAAVKFVTETLSIRSERPHGMSMRWCRS